MWCRHLVGAGRRGRHVTPCILVTQGDVDAGVPILNTATVDAAQVDPVTSNQVSVPVVAARPGLEVEKTPDPGNVLEPRGR